MLDVVMPGMGGAEVFARLKQMNPHVKVLISSGYAGDSRLIDLLKEGSAGFIKKPFEIDKLSRMILEILDKD